MADAPIIWRVNRSPRFPVLALGEYMVAEDGPRETLRRRMKYERIAPSILYRKIQSAAAQFLASPRKEQRILDRCREELEGEREGAKTARAAENATYALRALDAFERSHNRLPLGGMTLTIAPISSPESIEGVKVSVQPSVLISISRPRGKDLKGGLILDHAKGEDPKTDDAAQRAKMAMQYSAFLLHEHILARYVNDNERSSPEHCAIYHAFRQELVASPDNYKKLLRNVEAACRDIAARWDQIDPPASFDPTKARFRN